MNSIADILENTASSRYHGPHEQHETTDTMLPNATEKTQDNLSPTYNQHPQLKTLIHAMKDQLDAMLRILENEQGIQTPSIDAARQERRMGGDTIIEGVFNGEKMVGSDGHEYPVPPNYASKSKLVEGDMMKLTITSTGSFIYKQTHPIPRKRVKGSLMYDQLNEQWTALSDNRRYKILKASATFYKGKQGDEAIMFVPEDGESIWGAIDNIIHQ